MRKRKAPSISPFSTTGGKGSIKSGSSAGSKNAAIAESYSSAGLGPNQLKSQYLGRQVEKNQGAAEQQDAAKTRKSKARFDRMKSAIGGGSYR